MRVALGQIDMAWERKAYSLEKAEVMIKQAAESKADVIIFPEMTLTGFSMNLYGIGEHPKKSESIYAMKKLAVQNKIAIGFGWAARPEGMRSKGSNRFTLIDKEGQVIAEYKKIHPFTYGGESDEYEKGNKIVTVPFLGHTISLFICYDLRFPELFQIASREADVIFVIANWPKVRREHWTTLLRARAIETQSYVVGVNCYGTRDHEDYNGDSMVVDSIGNIIGKISGREGVLVCDIDDRAWSLRNKFNTRNDRREDFYIKQFRKKTKKR